MTHFDDNISFYMNEQMYGEDETEPEFKYFYVNGQLQCYLYKGIFYTGTWLEHWAKFQYNYGVLFSTGPAHCRRCVINGSKNGVMIGPCLACAPRYNDYELGPGFNNFRKEAIIIIEGVLVPSVYDLHMKNVDLSTIGRPLETVLLDESLELLCSELQDKLFEKHDSSVDKHEAIKGLMRFIKSFNNIDEIRKKIDIAILIPDSEIYNKNWAKTDWDLLTFQVKNNIYIDQDVEFFFEDYFKNEYCVELFNKSEEKCNEIDLTPELPLLLDDKMLEKILKLSNNEYLLYAEHIVNKHIIKEFI